MISIDTKRGRKCCVKIVPAAFLGLFWIVCSSICQAFPLEQFKEFINTKPTINDFSFELSTTKFNVTGLDPNAVRRFTLIMENDNIYRLTEDERGYAWKLTFPKVESTNVEPFKPPQETSWARYGNQFWDTFNLSDIITTTIQTSNAIPTFGPARESYAMLNIAYDALNLGIMDLRTIGVTWSNLNFVCQSNIVGYKVSGHLDLDDHGVPKNALYTLSGDTGSYHYKASYYFTTNKDLPDFMPSRITITLLETSPPMVMSDYKLQRLVTSSGRVPIYDVALVVASNTQGYVYTNKTFYHIKTNGWVRIGSSTEVQQPALNRKLVVIVTLAIVFFFPMLFLLLRTFRNRRKNK